MGNNGVDLKVNYKRMGTVQHINRFFGKKWQDHPYALGKSARKCLILRNTEFIINETISYLSVECRQVIEEFMNRLIICMRGFCVGGSLEGAGV